VSTLIDHFRHQTKPRDYSWVPLPPTFAQVEPYQSFWTFEKERWTKIPEINGVNATRNGGGQSARFFHSNQRLLKIGFDEPS
jgi:hypothetical protein